MKKRLFAVLLVISIILSLQVFSHEEEEDFMLDHSGLYPLTQLQAVGYGSFAFGLIVAVILLFHKKMADNAKKIIYMLVVIVVGAVTIYLIVTTLHLNITSISKGPVHWHADFEIWKCGKKLDIIDPEGMANRVGSRLFHEHGDGRMHVEGIIKNIEDVDLHNFFKSIGGDLSEISFNIPADHNIIEVSDGELCNGEPAEVQIFAYVVSNPDASQKSGFLVEQLKVNGNYILSPYQDVPPGDCIIVEFDKRKNKTDKICETYRIAVEQGRMMIL